MGPGIPVRRQRATIYVRKLASHADGGIAYVGCRARCTGSFGLFAATGFSPRRLRTDFSTGAEAGQPARVCLGLPLRTLACTSRKFGRGGRCMINVPEKVAGTASSAKSPDAMIAVGLGLTNECNLSCSFCYRDPTRTDRLSLDQVKSIIE